MSSSKSSSSKVGRVRITLEVDATFIRLLNANLQMKGLLAEEPSRDPDILQMLDIVALGEAKGALAEQIWAKTPPVWRPHIEAVHDERRWKAEGQTDWHRSDSGP